MLVEQVHECKQKIRKLEIEKCELERRLKILEEGDSRVLIILEDIKKILLNHTSILTNILNREINVLNETHIINNKDTNISKIKKEEKIYIPKIDTQGMEIKLKNTSVIKEDTIDSDIEELSKVL